MSHYKDKRRFYCESNAGKSYVIIEQMRIASRQTVEAKTDYMTEQGEIVSRLDESHFLILLNNEVVTVQRGKRRQH
ncbi:hypothetical protein ASE04_25655 [Rhizobium sp. Root708]|uniref:hypothetical protein n=1 Tax=Rhizobium sp. Root708 TaxID=1736592 RepID=UPI0006F923F2|nr:hypothetical protein [Rhizobium sp. Root708]KRB60104.1 hypothetical protein ASE04_25655 [Rhizobium sp. Root708]